MNTHSWISNLEIYRELESLQKLPDSTFWMWIETHYSYETSFLTQNSYFDVINNDNLCKFDAIFKYLFSFVFYCFLFLIISIVLFLMYSFVLEYIKLLWETYKSNLISIHSIHISALYMNICNYSIFLMTCAY